MFYSRIILPLLFLGSTGISFAPSYEAALHDAGQSESDHAAGYILVPVGLRSGFEIIEKEIKDLLENNSSQTAVAEVDCSIHTRDARGYRALFKQIMGSIKLSSSKADQYAHPTVQETYLAILSIFCSNKTLVCWLAEYLDYEDEHRFSRGKIEAALRLTNVEYKPSWSRNITEFEKMSTGFLWAGPLAFATPMRESSKNVKGKYDALVEKLKVYDGFINMFSSLCVDVNKHFNLDQKSILKDPQNYENGIIDLFKRLYWVEVERLKVVCTDEAISQEKSEDEKKARKILHIALKSVVATRDKQTFWEQSAGTKVLVGGLGISLLAGAGYLGWHIFKELRSLYRKYFKTAKSTKPDGKSDDKKVKKAPFED